MRTAPHGAAVAALLRLSAALLVTDGSTCSVQCGNVLDATTASDVTCDESSYQSNAAGIVFEKCIRCEATSKYNANGETDQQWMLYNLRFATSYCLFGDPNNTDASGSPCVIDKACGSLKEAIEFNNLTTKAGAYDYCQKWNGELVEQCRNCLTAGQEFFLGNFVGLMDTACQQKPIPSHTLAFKGDPFSTDVVNATTPTPDSLGTWNPDNSVLNLGARVGIAVGGIVLILLLVGCGIVWNGKRRRRAFLRDLQARNERGGWKQPRGPHGLLGFGGGGGGGDGGQAMFETPVSQKPLRGWGDSPVSATTETTDRTLFGRYFSPYSSTYNSPVSAVEGPSSVNWPTLSPQKLNAMDESAAAAAAAAAAGGQLHHPHSPASAFANWPTSTQEKLMQMQMQYERDYPPPVDIGVAFGGDEASLRSKGSDPQFNNNNNNNKYYPSDDVAPTDKGKSPASEAYEMHEVDGSWRSNGPAAADTGHLQSNNPYRMPAEPQAPVLHHPGYGRRSSTKRSATMSTTGSARYGGLTEEDARRGDAV